MNLIVDLLLIDTDVYSVHGRLTTEGTASALLTHSLLKVSIGLQGEFQDLRHRRAILELLQRVGHGMLLSRDCDHILRDLAGRARVALVVQGYRQVLELGLGDRVESFVCGCSVWRFVVQLHRVHYNKTNKL